jgi:hypothetical protein
MHSLARTSPSVEFRLVSGFSHQLLSVTNSHQQTNTATDLRLTTVTTSARRTTTLATAESTTVSCDAIFDATLDTGKNDEFEHSECNF